MTIQLTIAQHIFLAYIFLDIRISQIVRLRFEAGFLEIFESNLDQTNQIRGALIQNPRPMSRRFGVHFG